MAGASGEWTEEKDPLAGLKAIVGGLIPTSGGTRSENPDPLAGIKFLTGGWGRGSTTAPGTPGIIPPGQPNWADVQDLEGGAAFNRAPLAIPPAPSPNLLLPPGEALTVPKAPAEVTRKQLETAGSQGLLPTDFFSQNPEFAGGVMKAPTQFPRWDLARHLRGEGISVPEMGREEMLSALQAQPGVGGEIALGGQTDDYLRKLMDARGLSYFKLDDLTMTNLLQKVKPDLFGKLYTLLEPKQDNSLQGRFNSLIGQYQEKITDLLARGDTAGALAYGRSFKDLVSQLHPLITAQTGATKAPAEIKALEASAAREQIFTGVPTGQTPGEVTAYRAAPGQAPTPFATGILPTGGHSEQVQAQLITNALNKNADRKARALMGHASYMASPTEAMTALQPLFDKWDQETRDEINGIPAIMKSASGGVVPTQGAAPGRKMTWTEFYTRSRALGHQDTQILQEGTVLLQQGKIVR